MALGDLSEKQLLGLTAGIVGAVLLITAGLLVFIYLRYKGLTDEIAEKKARVSKMEKKAETLPDVKKRKEEIKTQLDGTLKKVPKDAQGTELDAQLSEQATLAKLTLRKIEPVVERTNRRKAATKQKHEAIRLRIKAEGNFNSFGQFLNNIERNMDRFIEVTGFKISAYEDGLAPGKGLHEIEISLVTYKYVDPKAAKDSVASKAKP